jgi:hypothetical protein
MQDNCNVTDALLYNAADGINISIQTMMHTDKDERCHKRG